ncbi:MAG: calcium/sodium antiporter [Pseudomonadota bacterium]
MVYLLLFFGIALLLLGGTCLVRGASGIAQAFHVPPMIIGLTVVAFGTSTPELVINVTGALSGETDLAFGNAVGSNLANFGLVLGVAALMSPIYLQGQVVRREVPFLLLVTAILMVMAWDEPLSGTTPLLDRGDAIILFLLFTIFVYFMVRDVFREEGDPILQEAQTFPVSATASQNSHFALNTVLLVAGMVMLVYGGDMTITQGSALAALLQIPEVVIGIFVVAVGTSLPELVTSAIAAYKRETDLALGNIVGSNIFNSLMVLPAAAIIQPLPIPQGGDWDLAAGFLFVLVVIPLFFFSNARLGRPAGAALVIAYFAYLAFRLN